MGSDDDCIPELLKSPEPNPNLADHIPEIRVHNSPPPLNRDYPPFREIRDALPPHCNALDIPPQLLQAENYLVPKGYFNLVDRSELHQFPWYIDVPPKPDSLVPYNPIFLQKKGFTFVDRTRLSLNFSPIRDAIPRFFTPSEMLTIYQARGGANGLEIKFWVVTPDNEVSQGNARLGFNNQDTCVISQEWYSSQKKDAKAYLDGLFPKPKPKVRNPLGLCLKSKVSKSKFESENYLWFFYDNNVPTFALSTTENSSFLSDPVTDPDSTDEE